MSETFSPFSGALLLCVDVQPVFLNAIPNAAQLLRRCSFAIEAAQALGMKIAFTEQAPQKLGGTAPELLALVKKPHLFGKNSFSALADDGIRDALRSFDVEHIILCGLETSICVYQTTLDAVDAHFQVTVLTDAVASRRPEDAAVCLDALVRLGAYVLPSETVFYSIVGDTNHPAFKPFTQLVKKYA
jgi:nicotinamidase-related amidase